MKAPLIGITTYGRNIHKQFFLPAVYVEAVWRAGGVPHLLPPCVQQTGDCLAPLDGLVLTGGGDVEPSRYGGRQHDTIRFVDSDRDASEFALARYAVDHGIPTLAICRGAQVINIVEGGTLHEHVPEVYGDKVLHRSAEPELNIHPITVQPNTVLASILNTLEFNAASRHHQAVRDLAPTLIASAHAPDGLIEAMEMPKHPWLICVQWHPEATAATEPLQQQLFNALINFVKKA